MTNRIDLQDLVPDHIDRIDLPGREEYWRRDTVVCCCGDDSGLRYLDPYRSNQEAYCDACGRQVRDWGGSRDDFAVPANRTTP